MPIFTEGPRSRLGFFFEMFHVCDGDCLASWHPGADDGGFKIWDTRHVSAGPRGLYRLRLVRLPEVDSLLE